MSDVSVTIDTVEITIPPDGAWPIRWASALRNGCTGSQSFSATARLEGANTGAQPFKTVDSQTSDLLCTNTAVGAGAHAVTVDAGRDVGSGEWSDNRRKLEVMLLAPRAAVTDAPTDSQPFVP